MNTSELLRKAKDGQIARKEVERVVQRLRSPAPGDRYTLLHIIGKSSYPEYSSILEEYLESPQDPMLARIALQALCSFMGLASNYVGQLRSFIRGVPWDQDEEVRLVALSAGGEYLREHLDRAILTEVLDVFTNPAASQTSRESAYFALARAYGLDWEELPSAARHFDLDADTDPRVLEWAVKNASA